MHWDNFHLTTSDKNYYRIHAYINYSKSLHFFKIFRPEAKPFVDYKWRWPFIDIIIYIENTSHITYRMGKNQDISIPRNRFYPLILRPLGGLRLLSPADPGYILSHQYGHFCCKPNAYSHRHESRTCRQKNVDCKEVFKYYPQVWSAPRSYGQIEVLRLGNEVLQIFRFKNGIMDSKSFRPLDYWFENISQWTHFNADKGNITVVILRSGEVRMHVSMMTSSSGNIFRVTGHLCGEFTGLRWIPHTKASDAELWCFLWSVPE